MACPEEGGNNMRMAELSRASGVAIGTIKYYLREGLVPPGRRTGPNQASYDDGHVRRLRLVRALLDVGGLSIATVKDVLTAIDEQDLSTHQLLGLAMHGLPPLARTEAADPEAAAWAQERVEALLTERGWNRESPLADLLVGVLGTLHTLGYSSLASVLDRYAEAAQRVAEADLDHVAGLPSTESIVESAVVGTVFGDTLFTVLRRLAHVGVSATVFDPDADGAGE